MTEPKSIDGLMELAGRLDERAAPVERWAVMNRAKDAFCIDFMPPNSHAPQREGERWMADNKAYAERNGYHLVRSDYQSEHQEDCAAASAAIRAYAESLAQPALNVDALHWAIMNLPCTVPPKVVDDHDDQAYHLGHRDARHAAAELVNALKVKP